MTEFAESTLLDAWVDQIALAIEADSRFDGVKVRRGWPGDLASDDFKMPAIAILGDEGTPEKARRPEYRVDENEDDTITQLFERESVPLVGNIELWARSKTERAPLEIALRSLLSGGLVEELEDKEPRPPGLELVLARYWDVTCRVRLEDSRRHDERTARLGHVRTTFELASRAPRIEAVKYNKATVTHEVEVTAEVEI